MEISEQLENAIIEDDQRSRLENEKDISKNIGNRNNVIVENQDGFLKNMFSKGANFALDLGIKTICPDMIEDQIIEIKDAIFQNGFKNGFEVLVDKVKDFGKSVLGLFTGKFNNISEMEVAVKKGGIISTFSNTLSKTIDLLKKEGIISNDIAKMLKQIKNTVVKTFSNKIENIMFEEVKKIEKIEDYQIKWYDAFENRDIEKMKSYSTKMNDLSSEVTKFENILENVDKINEIQNLVSTNKNFEYKGIEELLKQIV